jgi:ABC-type transport system substrate-binding protein
MLPPKYHTNNSTQNTFSLKMVEPIINNSMEDIDTTCDNNTAELTHTSLCKIIPSHAPFIPLSHTLALCKDNPFSSDKSTSTPFTISPTTTHTPFIFGMNPIVIPPRFSPRYYYDPHLSQKLFQILG